MRTSIGFYDKFLCNYCEVRFFLKKDSIQNPRCPYCGDSSDVEQDGVWVAEFTEKEGGAE